MQIEIGLEREAELRAHLAGRRFGLLMNQASCDRRFRYAHRILDAAFPGQLTALFSPQHGLFGEQQDNMIETPHGVEPRTGVPIYSLYADRRQPTEAMLEDLDVLVVDLQDVGTRVYTFIWTVSHCLEICGALGKQVLVLDRPNPVGGAVVEGPMLDPAFASFVGRAAIPMRHGLTIGEMTAYLNVAMDIGAAVDVVPVAGWKRGAQWDQLQRPWVPTSPNLPRWEGVAVYPGQVLLEGTTLSEGRGTTTPFEICGAPGIDPEGLASRWMEVCGASLRVRPIRFEPTFQKHRGRSCGGVFLHPVDVAGLRSYRDTLALLGVIAAEWPESFGWLPPGYEYEMEKMPIDILTGGTEVREAIDAGLTEADLDDLCAIDVREWDRRTADHRLYPGPLTG